jgi:hypothetical protein
MKYSLCEYGQTVLSLNTLHEYQWLGVCTHSNGTDIFDRVFYSDVGRLLLAATLIQELDTEQLETRFSWNAVTYSKHCGVCGVLFHVAE